MRHQIGTGLLWPRKTILVLLALLPPVSVTHPDHSSQWCLPPGHCPCVACRRNWGHAGWLGACPCRQAAGRGRHAFGSTLTQVVIQFQGCAIAINRIDILIIPIGKLPPVKVGNFPTKVELSLSPIGEWFWSKSIGV